MDGQYAEAAFRALSVCILEVRNADSDIPPSSGLRSEKPRERDRSHERISEPQVWLKLALFFGIGNPYNQR